MSCPLPESSFWSDPDLVNGSLKEGEVHVWRASIAELKDHLPRLARFMTSAEHRRAERYQFEINRRMFITGRGLLRALLSRYLGEESAYQEFNYNAEGKPALRAETASGRLFFNVTHSKDMVLICLALNQDLGIDVEYLDRRRDLLRIALRYFSPRELQVIRNRAGTTLEAACLRHWCYKEALAKGIGVNLFHILSEVEILDEGEGSRPCVRGLGSPWSLRMLPEPGADYVAALAESGECRRLNGFDLSKNSLFFHNI